MKNQKIISCIERAIGFVSSKQEKNGMLAGFTFDESYLSIKKRKTIFPSCLALSGLNNVKVESKKLEALRKKLAAFILSQKSGNWSFNYWERKSKDFSKEVYPDDLDDTFCALAALAEFDSNLIDEKAIAGAVSLLTFCEKEEGGPYATWIVSSDNAAWKDVDLAVNSNIAFFLSLQDVHLDNLESLVEEAIAKKKFFSPYYSSEYPVLYFISRFYRGSKTGDLIEFILKKRKADFSWGSALNTALACSALLNLGYSGDDLEKSIFKIISFQKSDGSWEMEPFVIERVSKGKEIFSSSPSLVSVFCVEALGKFLSSSDFGSEKTASLAGKPKVIYGKVAKSFEKRISSLGANLKQEAFERMKNMIEKDGSKQIVLLPYYAAVSLKGRRKIKDDFLVQLGLASLQGWLAYEIYDDIVDGTGDNDDIFLANIFLRELSFIFGEICANQKGMDGIFKMVMDEMEIAGKWETENCRFEPASRRSDLKISIFKIPDYGDYSVLASRSLGHSLGSLAVLLRAGYSVSSKEIKNILKFFRHFIIARQLNDDMHDWEEDLLNGCLNSVSVILLKEYQERHGLKYPLLMEIENSIGELQEIFWKESVVDFCQDVIFHTQKSKQCLKTLDLKTDYFEKIVDLVEKVAENTLNEHKNVSEIMNMYQ